MLASSIGWILTVSGLITALGGLIALLNPQFQLRSTYGVENPASIAVFLMRHWGVLILAIGCLIIYSADDPAIRVPVLIAAIAEKFAIGLLVFFGPVKRTNGMTVTAIVDGIFAILYVVYLAGRGANQFRKLPSAVRPTHPSRFLRARCLGNLLPRAAGRDRQQRGTSRSLKISAVVRSMCSEGRESCSDVGGYDPLGYCPYMLPDTPRNTPKVTE